MRTAANAVVPSHSASGRVSAASFLLHIVVKQLERLTEAEEEQMRTPWFFSIVLVAACSHAGTGEGTLESPSTSGGSENRGPVSFQWQSKANASDGAIQAKLPDGTQFKGTYLQMTSQASPADYGVYYGAWSDPVWGSPWYIGPEDGFVTRYSGHVVAHLRADNGERMRCAFTLREPVTGMNGGGEGDCQLSNKQTVFDARIEPGR